MTIEPVPLSPDLMAATEALAVNVRQSEPFVLYHLAREALESDSEAQALIKRLSEAQAEVRTSQARGQVTQANIEQLRALQGRAQVNRIITDYARTQQAAIAYLREVNQDISELLGVDFASLARQATCC
jgi:cell fate (sporulation/competence/biofilm development) regulator YlbF (YheA/YmcA/DUF963 family)